jgi:hypothetical protein
MASLLAFILLYGMAYGLYRLVPRRLYAGLSVWLLYPACFGLFVLLPYTGLILVAHSFPALALPIDRPALAALLVMPVYWFVSSRAVHSEL